MEASAVGDRRPGDPELMCDIVMKGGITSGVVYPGAVLALKERYRFKSIGGTSAGGIAAAVVAAAEHNRHGGGFDVVEALPGELASSPRGRPFMLQLFQPERQARPLFDVLVAFTRWGKPRALAYAVLRLWRPLAIALAVLVAGILFGFVELAALAALLLYVAGLALEVFGALRFVGRNDFGMCRLGPEVGSDDEPALTAWLDRLIQRAAGLPPDRPLTFADLWAEDPMVGSREPEKRATDLQMMTTDLTHGRPMRLPVLYQRHEDRLEQQGGRLFFDQEELRRFFPGHVVDHLVDASPAFESEETPEHLALAAPDRELLRFPIGPELPVVVATRMTLSFPVLIAAVPLWELDYTEEPPRLTRVVFSDGGITSNFPVHFFDALLPTRPTFGLHLTDFPPGEGPVPGDPCAAIEGPPEVNARARDVERARVVKGVGGFFAAIKDAMQNWRDNAQAAQPGFRDRIVHIRLTKEEGGLNLAMTPDVITALNERGACAGERLVELFAGEPGGGPQTATRWNDHRFIRYRIAMSALEGVLRRFDRGHEPPRDPITLPYPDRVSAATVAPYPYTQERITFALETGEAYRRLVAGWGEESVDDGVPRPPSTLRVVPPV